MKMFRMLVTVLSMITAMPLVWGAGETAWLITTANLPVIFHESTAIAVPATGNQLGILPKSQFISIVDNPQLKIGQIAVGSDGDVWAVGKDNNLYHREGTEIDPRGTGWSDPVMLPKDVTSVKKLAVNAGQVFIIGSDGFVHRRTGLDDNYDGTGWDTLTKLGQATCIAVGQVTGRLWGVWPADKTALSTTDAYKWAGIYYATYDAAGIAGGKIMGKTWYHTADTIVQILTIADREFATVSAYNQPLNNWLYGLSSNNTVYLALDSRWLVRSGCLCSSIGQGGPGMGVLWGVQEQSTLANSLKPCFWDTTRSAWVPLSNQATNFAGGVQYLQVSVGKWDPAARQKRVAAATLKQTAFGENDGRTAGNTAATNMDRPNLTVSGSDTYKTAYIAQYKVAYVDGIGKLAPVWNTLGRTHARTATDAPADPSAIFDGAYGLSDANRNAYNEGYKAKVAENVAAQAPKTSGKPGGTTPAQAVDDTQNTQAGTSDGKADAAKQAVPFDKRSNTSKAYKIAYKNAYGSGIGSTPDAWKTLGQKHASEDFADKIVCVSPETRLAGGTNFDANASAYGTAYKQAYVNIVERMTGQWQAFGGVLAQSDIKKGTVVDPKVRLVNFAMVSDQKKGLLSGAYRGTVDKAMLNKSSKEFQTAFASAYKATSKIG